MISFELNGKATLLIGKVELGRGTPTAAVQCAAEELQIDIAQVDDNFRQNRVGDMRADWLASLDEARLAS